MKRRLLAEALGSLLLTATVIGSGIMAERLANGNLAVALIANTGATVAVLAALIAILGPVSGAHFNPAVSLIQAMRRALRWRDASAYALAQTLGCCLGAMLAHAMYDLPLIQASMHARTGLPQWLGEAVATFGLLLVMLNLKRSENAAWAVPAWIGAAYWFTSSTAFANPAITIARSLSNTFAGIAPTHVLPFIVAQMLGALLALVVSQMLTPRRTPAAAAQSSATIA